MCLCNEAYIGYTTRHLGVRVEEHHARITTAIYRHDQICQGNFDKNCFIVLYKSNSVNAEKLTLQCEQCEMTTTKKSSLERHVEGVHLELRRNECSGCDFTAAYRAGINHHIKVAHMRLKDQQCHECPFDKWTFGKRSI